MSIISRDEFLKMQSESEARRANYDPNRKFVGFFKLADDGDEAVVRFPYTDPSDFNIYTVHSMQNVDGRRFANVNCINDLRTTTNCPLCEAGVPLKQRFYIELVEYVRNDEGEIEAQPKVWDTSARTFIPIMTNLIMEYGDLTKSIFKIKRNGARGDMKTTYSIMYAPPTVYTDDKYPADFSGLEGYEVIGGAVLDKSYDELVELAKTQSGAQLDIQAPARQMTYAAPVSTTGTTPPAAPQAVPRRVQY